VWDMTTRSLRWVGQPYQTMFIGVAWSPDGTRLAAGSDDGSVYLWQGTDGTLLQQLQGHHGSVNRVVWSPDGMHLASGGSTGELFLWDVQSGERVQTFVGHSGVIQALAWSRSQTGASGQEQAAPTLISGDSDGLLRWWDVQSGECVCVQAAHQGMIRSLRVSPDGRWLGSCGDDGAIKIWDLCGSGLVQGTVPASPPLWRTLQHNRPYEGLTITGIKGLSEAQKVSLQALGAVEETVSSQ